jgi:hypothetical protein
LAVVAALTPAAAAEPVEPVDEIAREILTPEYQSELPELKPPSLIGHGMGSFVTVVLYVLLGVALVLISLWIVNEFILPRQYAGDQDLELGGEHATARTHPLEEPERLAAAGRFEEAIHLLLLHAFAHLSRVLDVSFSDSKTARELARELPLTATRRQALGELVGQVELSLFGGRPAGAEHYARCRRSFEELLSGETA